jgi:hypothetical protein
MATMIWTLLSIFVITPLGALAFDRLLFGNWIWHIAPEKVRDYEEHSGITTGASAEGLYGIVASSTANVAYLYPG